MSIAHNLITYLNEHNVSYDCIQHVHCVTAADSARASNVAMEYMAKAVVLQDEKGYVMAVLPSNKYLFLHAVNEFLGRQLKLAKEKSLDAIFDDCESGAIPALGEAYNMDVVWDDRLACDADVYVEAGDHDQLIHLTHKDFMKLMGSKPHTIIGHSQIGYPPSSAQVDYEDSGADVNYS